MIGLIERFALTTARGYLPTPARIRRKVIGYTIITLLVATAYVLVVVGGTIYLAETAGMVAATFLVALSAIAVALLAMAIMAYLDRRARIEAMLLRQQMAGSMQNQMLGVLNPLLPVIIRQSPVASAVMVASLAYAIARSRGVGRG